MKKYKKIGIQVPEILLPNSQVDLYKWSVVACDQYTSQPEYWKEVKELVGNNPSTLKIVFPEIYLEEAPKEERIKNIQKEMDSYLENDVLKTIDNMVYVERTIGGKIRKGLILAIDLEKYDYSPNSQTLIRATEGTIIDRLPPRIEIRQDASLELPHIIVLIDDPEKTVIEPLMEIKKSENKLYDFELMMDSGHLEGYRVPIEYADQAALNLEKLADPEFFQNKYQVDDNYGVLLFAMGDGNHSLATAKAIWEKKKEQVGMDHPSRYALVELNNVHDQSLFFEPIHRVLFDLQKDLITEFKEFYTDQVNIINCDSSSEMIKQVDSLIEGKHRIGLIQNHTYVVLEVNKPEQNLSAGTIQKFLDKFLLNGGFNKIDYVHGSSVVCELGNKEHNAGIYLPAMSKNSLFKTVILDSALPRKTFSMGESQEKRFYMECRKIK